MQEVDDQFIAFSIIAGLLDKHKVFYWLDGGALLGMIRESRFLPWDPDIDLSVDIKDEGKVREISKVHRHQGINDCPGKEITFYIRGIRVDVQFKEKIKDKYRWVLNGGDHIFEVPAKFYGPWDEIIVLGRHVPIPNHAEEYLEFRYGKGWTKPDPTWLTLGDDLSLVKGYGKHPACWSGDK